MIHWVAKVTQFHKTFQRGGWVYGYGISRSPELVKKSACRRTVAVQHTRSFRWTEGVDERRLQTLPWWRLLQKSPHFNLGFVNSDGTECRYARNIAQLIHGVSVVVLMTPKSCFYLRDADCRWAKWWWQMYQEPRHSVWGVQNAAASTNWQ